MVRIVKMYKFLSKKKVHKIKILLKLIKHYIIYIRSSMYVCTCIKRSIYYSKFKNQTVKNGHIVIIFLKVWNFLT